VVPALYMLIAKEHQAEARPAATAPEPVPAPVAK
jgi:hypothetical protein